MMEAVLWIGVDSGVVGPAEIEVASLVRLQHVIEE
jgi:hypothetical protein